MKYRNKELQHSNPVKVRVKSSQEIFYTFKHWGTEDIDGVDFISVCKFEPKQDVTQQLYKMRKDSLEYIK
jgi:hypothetical protein